MKNSLFKRAVAAVATVPIAFTQCLTFAHAVTNDAVQETAEVQDVNEDVLTLERILRIAPDGESEWNYTVNGFLTSGSFSGEIDLNKYREKILKKAGKYKTEAEYALDLISDVKYVVDGSGDIVITGKIAEPDFNAIIKDELNKTVSPKKAPGRSTAPIQIPEGFDTSILPEGFDIEELKKIDLSDIDPELLNELAEKYNVPELASGDISTLTVDQLKKVAQDYIAIEMSNIDFTENEGEKTYVGGEFKAVIKTSELAKGTTFSADFEYKCNDGNTYALGVLPQFFMDSLKSIKSAGDNGIESKFNEAIGKAIKEKYDQKLDSFISLAEKVNNYETRAFNAKKSWAEPTTAGVIKDINQFLINKKYKYRIPATATEIVSKSLVVDLIDGILNAAGGSEAVSITPGEIGTFIDNLEDVSLQLNAGSGEAFGIFADAEAEEVKNWVENDQHNRYIKSYKTITVKSNYGDAKTSTNTGDVDIQIERVLITAPGTTTVTTTSETTTTETTTSTDTTSKTTSATTTSETTTSSDTTSKTTSKVTTSSDTTSKTTSKVTTSSDTTSKTTSKVTTSSDTTSKTTSKVTTSSDTTSKTTSKVTTSSDTTSKTTSKVTTSSDTTSKTTSSNTTSSDTTSKTTSSNTTSSDTTSKTTSSNTTSSTTVTTLPVTTSLVSSYITFESKSSFYVSIDEAFDKSVLSNVVLHKIYVEGNGVDGNVREFDVPEDITADVTFGTATPSSTYKDDRSSFKYEIPIYCNGEKLKDAKGKNATITVYIALMGDANLDNLVDASDASQILNYYARLSTNDSENAAYEETLSTSKLVKSPTDEYEELAAFVADVHTAAKEPVTRETKKDKRHIDSNDASCILAYYARVSSDDYAEKTSEEIWAEVLKK